MSLIPDRGQVWEEHSPTLVPDPRLPQASLQEETQITPAAQTRPQLIAGSPWLGKALAMPDAFQGEQERGPWFIHNPLLWMPDTLTARRRGEQADHWHMRITMILVNERLIDPDGQWTYEPVDDRWTDQTVIDRLARHLSLGQPCEQADQTRRDMLQRLTMGWPAGKSPYTPDTYDYVEEHKWSMYLTTGMQKGMQVVQTLNLIALHDAGRDGEANGILNRMEPAWRRSINPFTPGRSMEELRDWAYRRLDLVDTMLDMMTANGLADGKDLADWRDKWMGGAR